MFKTNERGNEPGAGFDVRGFASGFLGDGLLPSRVGWEIGWSEVSTSHTAPTHSTTRTAHAARQPWSGPSGVGLGQL